MCRRYFLIGICLTLVGGAVGKTIQVATLGVLATPPPVVNPAYDLTPWFKRNAGSVESDQFFAPQRANNVVLAALKFPLIGGYLIAGSVQTAFGTTAFQQNVAKLGAAIIGLYPGWTSGGFTMNSAAAAVKAINPKVKLTNYTNLMEFEAGVGGSGSAYSPMWNVVNNNNWFLRVAWPAGAITDADGLSQQGINQTKFTSATQGGQYYLQWRPGWTAANELGGSNWDGIFLDNVFYQPRVSADYNQSGSSQTASAAAQNWRDGYSTYVPLLKAALPGVSQLVWGNTADWDNGAITGYNQLLDGGVIESLIGQSYSYEHSSWTSMMHAYKTIQLATTSPGYQIFEQDSTATAYQAMRYGLCSCLLDNAYFYLNINGPGGGAVVTWFDEFDFNLGTPAAGPAGSANATYSNSGLTVWSQGVWRRDFANGISLVNPRGNGSQTVALGGTFYHLRGTQANPPNDASSTTSVTLADPNVAGTGGDGLILSRTPT